MKVLALRHLPTELNQKGVLQGRMDADLYREAFDEEQIRQNRLIIDEYRPEKVFVSPLLRTKETARLYGLKEYEVDERLIEYDFGRYEGQPKKAMLEKEGDRWLRQFSKVSFGEGFEVFSRRVDQFIAETKRRYQVILIVSHGVVIRYLLEKFGQGNVDRTNELVVENNSMNIIEIH